MAENPNFPSSLCVYETFPFRRITELKSKAEEEGRIAPSFEVSVQFTEVSKRIGGKRIEGWLMKFHK